MQTHLWKNISTSNILTTNSSFYIRTRDIQFKFEFTASVFLMFNWKHCSTSTWIYHTNIRSHWVRAHFMPCWLSWCLRRSTLRWKPLPQMSHPNGLKPVCFLLWVIKLELWLNALPHTWHLWGFSPTKLNTHNTHKIICMKRLQPCFKNQACHLYI